MSINGIFGKSNVGYINVKDSPYGAVGDGVTDDTAAIQAAITACIGTGALHPKALYIPYGQYKITSSLQVLTGNTGLLTGWHVFGDGKFATQITQYTDNTPLFAMAPNLMHSCVFEHMTLRFNNMQTGLTSGNIFDVSGTNANDLYNSKWENITAENFYYFMNCPNILWWGNEYSSCWFGDCARGINFVTGTAGEPRNTFHNVYITCQSATGVLFKHNACSCVFDNVEVNAANSGATMIEDLGGGSYIISHFALEVGHYSTNNANLFDVTNGYLKAEWIYCNTLTIDTGVDLYVFNNSGGNSRVKVDRLGMTFASLLGRCFINRNGASNNPNHYNFITEVPFSAGDGANSAVCQLTNVVGAQAADNCVVDEWSDQSRVQINGDANASASAGAAYLQVFDVPFTADRTFTLPEDRQVTGNNLFSGRRFKIVKDHSASANFALNIKNVAGTTIATIASATSGIVELCWHRDGGSTNFTWMIIDNRTF